MLETVRGAARSLQTISNCCFQCDYYYYYGSVTLCKRTAQLLFGRTLIHAQTYHYLLVWFETYSTCTVQYVLLTDSRKIILLLKEQICFSLVREKSVQMRLFEKKIGSLDLVEKKTTRVYLEWVRARDRDREKGGGGGGGVIE